MQSGNEVTIGDRHNNRELYNNISIDYDITLPRASALTAMSGSGDIDIQDVGASLKADTGSGSVHAHGIQGAANLQTGSGSIQLQQTGSGEVVARTGSGSIEIDGKPTTAWKVDTGSGSIKLNVGKVPFNVNASTGSGGIRIEQPFNMQGDLNRHHVTAAVNGGGPVVSASTGSGDIHIQ